MPVVSFSFHRAIQKITQVYCVYVSLLYYKIQVARVSASAAHQIKVVQILNWRAFATKTKLLHLAVKRGREREKEGFSSR